MRTARCRPFLHITGASPMQTAAAPACLSDASGWGLHEVNPPKWPTPRPTRCGCPECIERRVIRGG